jgi:hypothetical protein
MPAGMYHLKVTDAIVTASAPAKTPPVTRP